MRPMSWLDLIISAWRISVNGVEQAIPTWVNYIGTGVTSAAVGDQLNVTFAAPYQPYSVAIAGPAGVVAGGSVVLYPDTDGLWEWASGVDCVGVAVNAGAVGELISVQSYGETTGINHALWAAKPTAVDISSPVYAAAGFGYTLTPNATPGQYNQKLGIVWFADNGAASDTTTILLNIQPPVIVPAS